MNRAALMIELYIREVVLDQAHRAVLWSTAIFLRDKAREVQKKVANRPMSIEWFRA
jgi:hypothetical protein